MHEMSLAESVVQIIEDSAQKGDFCKVTAVFLEIGRLAGVEVEAMRFCFDVVTRGTLAEGADLLIEQVPGQGWCLDCGHSVALMERFAACPECGGYKVQITGGTDMRVKELAVE